MAETLQQLGEQISKSLASGIPLLELQDTLAGYSGDDWEDHKCFCCEKYQRKQAYHDEQVEILVLCWDSYQSAKVHDHPEKGCLVRMMSGSLREDTYLRHADGNIRLVSQKQLPIDGITYKEGKGGLHAIINDEDERACTIHVYAPPGYCPTFFDDE